MSPVKPGEMSNGRKFGYLYEANIRPYMPFAIRGVLWDQGEAGTGFRDIDQYTLMGALIRGWRKEWGQATSRSSTSRSQAAAAARGIRTIPCMQLPTSSFPCRRLFPCRPTG